MHPYAGNVSTLGDCLKLVQLRAVERRGVVVVTYSHNPPEVDFEPLVRSFELIATDVLGIQLGTRASSDVDALIHPIHTRATVFGWEVGCATA